ncbi:hypothetical protein GGS23DRAFT_209916 [Durotheca rogersii]|uniref:uncharacterized protein n=1 Tax=Durotheca rogersii TaxID=419775 RepID=UPI00221F1A32|nr:uncharacterized protein GGS23DRAFT_209916 [Durotheca rogersii]KAI5860789.1 hypothetical protein GGS23DRAFT_209916 [Durotheca rogersii]
MAVCYEKCASTSPRTSLPTGLSTLPHIPEYDAGSGNKHGNQLYAISAAEERGEDVTSFIFSLFTPPPPHPLNCLLACFLTTPGWERETLPREVAPAPAEQSLRTAPLTYRHDDDRCALARALAGMERGSRQRRREERAMCETRPSQQTNPDSRERVRPAGAVIAATLSGRLTDLSPPQSSCCSVGKTRRGKSKKHRIGSSCHLANGPAGRHHDDGQRPRRVGGNSARGWEVVPRDDYYRVHTHGRGRDLMLLRRVRREEWAAPPRNDK